MLFMPSTGIASQVSEFSFVMAPPCCSTLEDKKKDGYGTWTNSSKCGMTPTLGVFHWLPEFSADGPPRQYRGKMRGFGPKKTPGGVGKFSLVLLYLPNLRAEGLID